jgi:hypothetical protein
LKYLTYCYVRFDALVTLMHNGREKSTDGQGEIFIGYFFFKKNGRHCGPTSIR